MARLTKKDFQWLATEIAPLLADGTLDEFTSSVRKHSKNGRFQKDKFMMSLGHLGTQQTPTSSWLMQCA